MTSPNFAFPQPTDDELAAQGPAIAPTDPPARATVVQPGGTVYPGPTVYGGTVYGGATGATSVSADAVPAVHRPVQTGPVDAAVASGTPRVVSTREVGAPPRSRMPASPSSPRRSSESPRGLRRRRPARTSATMRGTRTSG
ncbi:hypothetical protein IOD13_18425 [Brevibacterium casei]|nr:hypothetical protein [Brevibacterium casei]